MPVGGGAAAAAAPAAAGAPAAAEEKKGNLTFRKILSFEYTFFYGIPNTILTFEMMI